MSDAPTQSEARIQDRMAIYDVMVRYCHGVDRREFTMVADCFHPEATANYRGQPCRNPDEIMAHCQGIAGIPVSTHFLGNQLVTFTDSGAEVETYAIAYLWRGEIGAQVETRNGLRYLDKMVRQNNRWVILERELTCDWTRTDPVPPSAPPLPGGKIPQ